MEQKSISGMNKAAAQMGKKGGLAGKGATKRRGNASYYRDMQRKSVLSRSKNLDKVSEPKKK
jgi:hypothetical protein